MTRSMERLALTHTLARTLFGRRDQPGLALSRRAAQTTSSATACGPRPGAGMDRPRPRDRAPTPASRCRPATRCGMAPSAKASSPGCGQGGCMVRFADGTERRLMVEYAPLEKITSFKVGVPEPRRVRAGRLRDRAVLRPGADRGAHRRSRRISRSSACTPAAERHDRRRRRRVSVPAVGFRWGRAHRGHDGGRNSSRPIGAAVSSPR